MVMRMTIKAEFEFDIGDGHNTEASRITDDDDELNVAPQNPISDDNQLETPDEEASTELCVIDSGSPLSSEIGPFRGRLSLVPANYNLMPLRQQQDLFNAVDHITHLLQSMEDRMGSKLREPANILRNLSLPSNIFRFKKHSEGQVIQINSLPDDILKAAVGRSAVKLSERKHLQISQIFSTMTITSGEGEIQAANSQFVKLFIDIHQLRQGIQTTVQSMKYDLNRTHQGQRYSSSFTYSKDVYDFSHEAFNALCGGDTGRTTRAVVEELD